MGRSSYYLDGSGGDNTQDSRSRRCGWAAVCLDEDKQEVDLEQAIFGSLARARQTVPRAELTVAVML